MKIILTEKDVKKIKHWIDIVIVICVFMLGWLSNEFVHEIRNLIK